MTITLPQALKESRCILHIDLGINILAQLFIKLTQYGKIAFIVKLKYTYNNYVQLEQVRLGISSDVPAAVQQWQNLIAVNYPARQAGIDRHCTVEKAKELCPEIKLLHVPTYAANEIEPQYRENPDRATHKVSLDPYRAASLNIFKIFHKYCDKIQKIGLDEAFMDVTSTVNQRLMEYIDCHPELLDRLDDDACNLDLDWDQVGITIESKEEEERRQLETDESHWSKATWRDLQLYFGAELAAKIRHEIYTTLQYTCSAVLRNSAALYFMEQVPFTKIRNLGGKLGSEVESGLSIDKASDLWKYTIEELQIKFGDSTGRYLYHISRGVDNEEIIPMKAPKSIMASKQFNPAVENVQEMDRWFSILAIELRNRVLKNYEEFNTWPKTFTLQYASIPYLSFRSKAMGPISREEMKDHGKIINKKQKKRFVERAYCVENITKKLEKVFKSVGSPMPCSGLQFSASNFTQGASQLRPIHQFFNKIPRSLNESSASSPTCSQSTYDKPRTVAPLWNQDINESLEYLCDKCHKKILLINIDEHTDYHFALDIQKQVNQELDQSKKRANNDTQPSNKKKKLFFS
ncbi:DNA/RNA polymerase [Rhizopus microsporus ATCC 52813]|uniref:DNA polymerase eta n=1 Tax=Rhizopus microsporus ATCC 52813 TaxID=1340429 RepID=A0A2G4SUQ0_RHIZD|nr:DNA/RNA polymerase [Rhizopus microsporus ATCC 52813]PHZ12499.1 DNA/RNA polymerase [Rhizopus microsporus ATCC 52813]